MAIDFHVHPITQDELERSMPFFRRTNANRAIAWYSSQDLSTEGLLADMDRAGVDRAVILALDYNIDLPLLRISNDRVAQLVSQHPDRFIGFASVCPTEIARGESRLTRRSVRRAVRELRRSVEVLGLRGLKLLPPYQHFYPNDCCMWPLYAEAQRLHIPILMHTGGEDYPGLVRYCNPIYLDDVAKAFPELVIVAAHMGSYPFGVWFREMMMVVDENSNIYVDLAALRPRELIDEGLLRQAIDWIGSERILYGSDWPVVFDYSMQDAIRTIRRARISDADRENILTNNARRILGC